MRGDPNCTLCPLHKDAEFVCLLGEGPKQCDVMIIGEAPGQREDDSGRPFVGRSGRLLMEMLDKVGLRRQDVFITNAVSCRPPSNRTPKKKEIEACKKWLKYQIAMVKPKFILTLGNVPLFSLLGLTGIKKLRGKPVEKDGMTVLPTYHPSFALREPRHQTVIEKDIQTFRDIVDFGGIPRERALNYQIVDTWKKFDAMLDKLEGVVSYDLETSGLYPWGLVDLNTGKREKTWITSIILGVQGQQFVIPLNHGELILGDQWSQPSTLGSTFYQLDKAKARQWLGDQAQKNKRAQQKLWDKLVPRLMECELVGQNMKFDVIWTWVKTGHRLRIDFDTMLAHYILDENSLHDLEHLAGLYFGAPNYDIALHEKHGFGPLERHCQYAASDGFYTRKLRFRLMRDLKEDLQVKRVFDYILMPAANLYCEIEYHGVYINEEKMDDAEAYLIEEMRKAQAEWNKWGKDVNMASPKQIGELLYDKLKIKCPQLTPKGGRSTSESALNQIDHPCVASLLKYRGASQQFSFFIEGWKPYLVDGRLHPSFKLHGTVTGRPSCENPNLQQVPRDPRIRSLITAPPGRSLLDADLSQIELRIAAWLANERNMIQTFRDGGDAHWLTCLNELARGAAEADLIIKTANAVQDKATVKSIVRQAKKLRSNLRYADAIKVLLKAGPDAAAEIDKSWKELRKKAKAVNFGYLYGMWWKKFKIYARDNYGVVVTDEEAQDSRIAFFDTYPDFPEWHKRQKRYVRLNGFVKSPSGRKRRLPRSQDRDDTPERREAERQAINSPVQSFASDLNLMAALQLRKEFPGQELFIIGTVHDAILIDVENKSVQKVAARLLEIMRGPDLLKTFGIDIPVPIEGEVKVGPWSEGKDVVFEESRRAVV
jgi:uracil-DNA glycosylase family 4